MLHGHVEGAEVRGLIADAHAQDDAPLGDEIQRDDIFREAHRMVQGRSTTDVPTLRRRVWAATAVATMSGEGRKPSLS